MSSDTTSVADASPSASKDHWSPPLVLSIVACMLGGLITGTVIHAKAPFFQFANLPELGINPPPELVAKFRAATYEFWTMNYLVEFGLVGLCLGAAIGLSAPNSNRAVSTIAGALSGLVSGAAAGYLVGRFIAAAVLASADQSLLHSVGYHFAIWGSILGCILLVVSSLQVGVLPGLNYLLLGIGSGFVVAVAYNLISSLAFSTANLNRLVPDTLDQRMVWAIACPAIAALAIHFGAQRLRVAEKKVTEKKVTEKNVAG